MLSLSSTTTKPMNQSRAMFALCALAALSLLGCGSDSSESSAPKGCDYTSTYDSIQETIFEAKGCTASACHGDAMEGGLDLRAGASFDALVRQPSTTIHAFRSI